jgi:hypothetical protein
VPFILKLGQRVSQLEKKFLKCRDICINNKEHLHTELKKLAPDVISILNEYDDTVKLMQKPTAADPYVQYFQKGYHEESLLIGEKLRVQI